MKQNTDTIEYRPPIVVIVGHIDHGKTTLIDFIRKSKIAEKESGGITQHIGAYQVEHQNRIITFLDTPGHEAFSAIRARGSKVADIAIVVVSADEGVKAQTKEAIGHVKDANIPFIVAINKMDKPEANPNKVRQELTEIGVLLEGWGGQTPVVEISAKTGKNVEELLEMVLLIADMENYKSSSCGPAQGIVIESHLDNRRGFVATLLVQSGTLKINDCVSTGRTFARIKMMESFTGQNVQSATPSQPVLTLGWNEAPELGEQFNVASCLSEAEKNAKQNTNNIQPLFVRDTNDKDKKTLNIIIKADVRSSLEAIDHCIKGIKHDEVNYRVLSHGVGNVTEADIKTASTSKAIIYGFHVETETSAKKLAEKLNIKTKNIQIIYDLIEELRKDMSYLLSPEIKRTTLGKMQVLVLFKKSTNYQIVGARVISGLIKRGCLIDAIRGGAVIASGRLTQLQENKNDIPEARERMEVGIKFEGTPIINEKDVLEAYEEEKIRRNI